MLYSLKKRNPKYSELWTINFSSKMKFKLCLREWCSFTMHREGENMSVRRKQEQESFKWIMYSGIKPSPQTGLCIWRGVMKEEVKRLTWTRLQKKKKNQ